MSAFNQSGTEAFTHHTSISPTALFSVYAIRLTIHELELGCYCLSVSYHKMAIVSFLKA